MNADATPAVRRKRPGTRYVRPSDVEGIRNHLELGWRVLKTVKDHYGPGEHALCLVVEIES